jgi:hypothetical protein
MRETAMTTLYKGLGRSGQLRENCIGLVFATTDMAVAEYYAEWGRGISGVATFELAADARIANLNDPATAREIVNQMLNFVGYELDVDAMVDELVNNDGSDHITIMDDFDFHRAVFERNYDGAMQSGHYAIAMTAVQQ